MSFSTSWFLSLLYASQCKSTCSTVSTVITAIWLTFSYNVQWIIKVWVSYTKPGYNSMFSSVSIPFFQFSLLPRQHNMHALALRHEVGHETRWDKIETRWDTMSLVTLLFAPCFEWAVVWRALRGGWHLMPLKLACYCWPLRKMPTLPLMTELNSSEFIFGELTL